MTAVADLWFDPSCPWSWRTFRWLTEVTRVRDVEVRAHPLSIALLHEGRDVDAERAAWLARARGPVRVVTAAGAEHGSDVVGPLYAALGTRLHEAGRDDVEQVLAEALAEVGLPSVLVRAASDDGWTQEWDRALRDSQDRATTIVGSGLGVPVVAIDGAGYFGPVLDPAPAADAAGRLWDGLALMCSVPGFYELKRSRTGPPGLGARE